MLCAQIELVAHSNPRSILGPDTSRLFGPPDILGRLGSVIVLAAIFSIASAIFWLPKGLRFFWRQWQAAQTDLVDKPGIGILPGSWTQFARHRRSGGSGPPSEACAPPWLIYLATIIAIVFAFLFVIGTKLALSRPSGFAIPLAALIMLLGAICMIVTQRYDYGAYKFLCIGWFLFALLIVEGLVWSSSGLKGDRPRAAVVLDLLLLLLPQTVLLGLRLHRFDASRPIKDMGYFRSVSKIQGVVGDAPVLVSSGSFLGSIQEPDKNPLLRAEA